MWRGRCAPALILAASTLGGCGGDDGAADTGRVYARDRRSGRWRGVIPSQRGGNGARVAMAAGGSGGGAPAW